VPAGGPGRPRSDRPWERRETDEQRLHRTYPAAEAAGLVAPGEELVAGRHPVEEALAARRPARRLLVVPQRREALERIVLHATTLRIPIVEVEGGTLTALAGFDGHQGVAVVLQERRFASLDEILARAIERGEPPFVLALDSLEDPQNLGSLLRSAEAAGVHGVIFPIRRQAPLTPAAVKASAGAVEHLLLVPVDDLAGALADLHVRGVRVVGAEADAALTHRDADLRGPLVLVVGHEGQGLGSAVRRRCDHLVRIPMRGRIASLNAAVAGSVLLFEAAGQRGEAPPPPMHADEPPAGDEPQAGDEPPAGDEPAREPEPAPKAKRGRKTAVAPADGEAAPATPGPAPKAKRGRKTAVAPADGEAAPATPGPAPKAKRTRKAKAAADASGPAAAPGAPAADDLLPGGPPSPVPSAKPKRRKKAIDAQSDAAPAPAPAAKPKRSRKKP
jgi:23S rRNA (guanosine2251-2'-O)-methyltransferase